MRPTVSAACESYSRTLGSDDKIDGTARLQWKFQCAFPRVSPRSDPPFMIQGLGARRWTALLIS